MKKPTPPRRLVEGGARDEGERALATLIARTELDRVPDGARARVWKRGARRAARPTWRWALAGASVGAACMALAVAYLGGSGLSVGAPGRGTVAAMDARTFRPLVADARLPKAARVRSNDDALVLRGEALGELALQPFTELRYVVDGEVALNVTLERGELTATTRAALIVVMASAARIELGDAIAQITLDEGEGAHVHVLRGAARVTHGGVERRVAAGERWSSRAVGSASAAPAGEAPPLASPANLETSRSGPPASAAGSSEALRDGANRPVTPRGRRSRAAIRKPAGEAEGAPREPGIEAEARRRPAEVASPKAAPNEDVLRPTARGSVAASAEAAPPTRDMRAASALDTPPIPSAPLPPNWDAMYERATREADARAAIAAFDRIAASGRAPWAERAAYQGGRRALGLRSYADAISRFQQAVGGELDEEARLGIIECRLRQRDVSSAERDFDAFIARHPDSAKAAAVRFVRADLLRQRGRCADALEGYRAAFRSRYEDEAHYLFGWCLLEVGRDDEGRHALSDYVARYPRGIHAEDAKKILKVE